MIFSETKLPGVLIVEPERRADERGFFARAWCAREMKAHGLSPALAQANIGFTDRKGGLRVEASNSHSTFFQENKVAIRAEERLALAVYRPAAFAVADLGGLGAAT